MTALINNFFKTKQSIDSELDGRKFFDFGFGNATGYYDIIDRPAFPDQLHQGTIFGWCVPVGLPFLSCSVRVVPRGRVGMDLYMRSKSAHHGVNG